MGKKEARKIYEQLLESGDLPSDFSGEWAKDRSRFIGQYEKDEEILTEKLDFFELDEDYEDYEEY